MQLRKATREDWKEVPGYGGRYSINSCGEVMSHTTRPRLMKPSADGKGYHKYVLKSADGKNKSHPTHRLVATLFIDNPSNHPVVNHIDGNPFNPEVTNLEWCTYSHNEMHSFRVLGKKANKPHIGAFNGANPNHKAVEQFDLSGNLIRTFPSMSEAHRHGFHAGHISLVCQGKQKQHKGFIWKYSKQTN